MTFAPKAVHIRIHVLDAGLTVILLSQERVKLRQGFEKIGMMIMWYGVSFKLTRKWVCTLR